MVSNPISSYHLRPSIWSSNSSPRIRGTVEIDFARREDEIDILQQDKRRLIQTRQAEYLTDLGERGPGYHDSRDPRQLGEHIATGEGLAGSRWTVEQNAAANGNAIGFEHVPTVVKVDNVADQQLAHVVIDDDVVLEDRIQPLEQDAQVILLLDIPYSSRLPVTNASSSRLPR